MQLIQINLEKILEQSVLKLTAKIQINNDY